MLSGIGARIGEFPVVLEDDRGRISRFKRHLIGTLHHGDPVTDEGMPQDVAIQEFDHMIVGYLKTVGLPFVNGGGRGRFTDPRINLPEKSKKMWN